MKNTSGGGADGKRGYHTHEASSPVDRSVEKVGEFKYWVKCRYGLWQAEERELYRWSMPQLHVGPAALMGFSMVGGLGAKLKGAGTWGSDLLGRPFYMFQWMGGGAHRNTLPSKCLREAATATGVKVPVEKDRGRARIIAPSPQTPAPDSLWARG